MARDVVLRFVGDAGQLNRTFAAVEAQSARTMGRLSAATTGAASTMGSSMTSAVAAMGAAGATMRRTGKTLTRSVSLPMAVIGGLGIKTAIDYEKSMNVLQAVSGATGEQMASFGKLAQDLGGDISLPGTSAADATQAMVELAKAGLSVTDTMGAAKGVLQLSAAGGLSNADAAQVAANALNAFGLKGTEAIRVSDLLAGAANASSADVADLALALADGGAAFAQAGIPIEDFITMTAQLANVGIKGAVGGTALKTMLMRLQNPSNEAAGLLEKLNLSIYDSNGAMKDSRTIIGEFSSAFKTMGEAERNAAVATIFGADASRAANGVLLAGVDIFNKNAAATTEQGAAAKMAAAQNKGLGGAFDGLKSAMETLMLKALVPALPALTRFVTAVANFIPKITAIPKPILIAAAAFAGLLLAAGPMLAIFGAMLSPLALIGAALAAVGVAIYAALNPEKAKALLGGLTAQFKLFWNALTSGFTEDEGSPIESFALKVREGFFAMVEWIKTNGPIIAAQLWSWGQAFIGWIAPMIPPLLEKLGHLLGAIGTWILETAVPAIGDKLRTDWIPAFTAWVAEITPPLLVELANLLAKILEWIVTEAAPAIIKAMVGLAGDIANGLSKAVGDLLPGGDNKITVDGKTLGPGGAGGAKAGVGQFGDKSITFGGKTYAAGFGEAGGGDWAKPIGLARGGLLLGLNRPTPILAGEGRGREDVLAVPHSRGGIGGMGGVSQTNHYHGVPLEEAMERSNRQLGWRLALAGPRL